MFISREYYGIQNVLNNNNEHNNIKIQNIGILINKYFNEIICNITNDVFIKLCKISSIRKKFIESPQIKTDIKFGSADDGIDKILIILDMWISG